MGYELIEESLTLTVNPDGTISAGSSVGGWAGASAPAALLRAGLVPFGSVRGEASSSLSTIRLK